jgi:hypothetical protein
MPDGFRASKAERRFAKAVRSSGLVPDEELDRALTFQAHAAGKNRVLPLDRILLKFQLLSRDQILGLWRALRYYLWRREDKFYVKLAVQSKILTPKLGEACLKEQKQAYKHDDELIRVNEIARRRGYLNGAQDRAIIEAMHKVRAVTLRPLDDEEAAEPFERPSKGAARKGAGDDWKNEARGRDLDALRGLESDDDAGPADSLRGVKLTASGTLHQSQPRGTSDDDLDALWDEADLDDVELDSQALEIARSPLLDLEDSDEEFDL